MPCVDVGIALEKYEVERTMKGETRQAEFLAAGVPDLAIFWTTPDEREDTSGTALISQQM